MAALGLQMSPLVSIVLLNYRNAPDTIECLESLLRLDYPNFEIIVCDNDSQDGSVAMISAWARGEIAPSATHPSQTAERVPRWQSGVSWRLMQPAALGLPRLHDDPLIHLIPTGQNGGFSAGNNVGLRHALAKPEVAFIWLLNNDTVVAPDALGALVERMRQDPSIGICGARLINYEPAGGVQALGGAMYARWRARARTLMPSHVPGLHGEQLQAAVEARMSYVIGASMLVPRRFVETVGLLSEAYFLYFEELDWVRRAAGRFRLGYCDGAVVYHRLGSTTGEALNAEFSSFHLSRSRIRFVAQFDVWALPLAYAFGAYDSLKALLKGRSRRAKGIWRGLRDSSPLQLLQLYQSRSNSPVKGGAD